MTSKSRSCSRIAGAGVALVVSIAIAAPAAADDPPVRSEAYEQQFVKGRELFSAGDYAEARAAFQAAYEEHPEPLLLFNIGSTYRREGNRAEAIAYYRRFLDEAPADDPYRQLAIKVIADLTAELARETKPDPPPDPSPEPDPRPLPPPAPSPGSDELDRGSRGRNLRIAGIAVGAAGVIASGVAVHQGLQARDIEAELEGAPAGTPFNADRYEEGEAAERRSIAFAIGGGVAIAAGVTLYIVGARRANEAPSIVVHATGDGAGISWSGEF